MSGVERRRRGEPGREDGARPLRVLYLTGPAGSGGGVGRRLGVLARELTRRGHEVAVAVPEGVEVDEAAWSAVERGASSRRALRGLLRRGGYGVVHTIGAWSLEQLYFATLFLRGAPAAVHTHHGEEPLGTVGGIALRGGRVRRVVVEAVAERDSLARRGRVPRRKIAVVPAGIDVDRFAPGRDAGAALRARLGVPTDAPVVGLLADPEGARADLYAEAASRAHYLVPEAHFVWIAEGEALRARARAEALGIAGRVHFVAPDAAETLLAGMELAVADGGAGARRLEALAAGVPLVAFDEGDADDVVQNGRTGLLSRSADARALAGHVAALLRDPARRRAMGAAAREDAVERYSSRAEAAAYEAIYQEARR